MNQTKKHTTGKKLLALLLALIMSVSLLPMSVFAADLDTEAPIVEGQTQQDAALDESDGEEEIVDSQEPVVEDPAPVEEDTTEDVNTLADADLTFTTENGYSYVALTNKDTSALPTTDSSKPYRAVMLDCGRKYFTFDQIKTLIDTMAQYGYNQLQLSFGNGGCRFLLDTMDLTYVDSKLTSDYVREQIIAGNGVFNGDKSYLTQSEMTGIISYANSKGIEIVPMLNMPGHSKAIDYAISGQKDDSLDTTNESVRKFAFALLKKYVDYFKSQGCSYFHFGSDESGEKGTNMSTFLASCANIIANAGMRPRAFNDETKLGTDALPNFVQITFWVQGYVNNNSATASELAGTYQLINTHGRWYYVVDSGTAETGKSVQYNSSVRVELPMTKKTGLSLWPSSERAYFDSYSSNVSGDSHKGTMFCIWCDNSTGMPSSDIISDNTTYGALYQIQELAKLYWPDDIKKTTAPVVTTESGAVVPTTMTANGTVTLKASESVTWTTSNANVIKLESVSVTRSASVTGASVKATAVGTGEATITATNASKETVSYTINVQDAAAATTKNVTLTVGESTTFTDIDSTVDAGDKITDNAQYIATAKVAASEAQAADTKAITSTTEISADKKYLIVNNRTRKVLTSDDGTWGSYTGRLLNGTASATNTDWWKITGTTGGFAISYNGDTSKYLTLGNNTSSLGTTVSAITLYYKNTDGYWNISQGNYYLNNLGGGNMAGGWYDTTGDYDEPTDEGSKWTIYEIVEETTGGNTLTITGTGEGKTSVTVGTVTYSITVTAPETTETKALSYGSSFTLPTGATAEITSGSGVTIEDGKVVAGNAAATAVVTAVVTNAGGKVTARYVYNITVTEIDFDNVADLPVQLWITNTWVGADSAPTDLQTVKISAKDAYSEEGILLGSKVPATGYKKDGSSTVRVTYWKGVVLHNGIVPVQQGTDYSNSGDTFTRVRYWDNSWQYQLNGQWVNIDLSTNKDTVIAYYLQINNVSPEITTGTQHYGNPPTAHPGDTSANGYNLTAFAVVYPDGTLSRTEQQMYETGMVRGFWRGTSCNIGTIYAENNSTYKVSKITVTWGANKLGVSGDNWYTGDKTGTYGEAWGVDWEKTTNSAGDKWYKETTYWKDGDSEIPMIDGEKEGLNLTPTKNAVLILIYLEVVETENTLNIIYWDDNGNKQITTNPMPIPVVVAPNVTFLPAGENGIQQTSAVTTGPFMLDDNAYIKNSSGAKQRFNKNLSTVPGVTGVYLSGMYQYVSAEISEDGMTLTLHFNLKSAAKERTYVVDFGLPLEVPATEFEITNVGAIHAMSLEKNAVTMTAQGNYGRATIADDYSKVTYELNKLLNGKATIPLYVTFADNTYFEYRVNIIPAANVYYEDSFAKFYGSNGAEQKSFEQTGTGVTETPGTWYADGNELTSMPDQALEELGTKQNVYGYDPAYNTNSTTFSMGSAKKVTVDASVTKAPTATFTFKGTGFDVISLTDNNSGAIVVNVTSKDGSYNKNFMVNNYYGYSYENGEWKVVESNDNNALYQIPVMKVTGLGYDEYNVTISVPYGGLFDKTGDSQYSFWLDAIRVYDPMGKDYADYTQDQEGYPQYIKLRAALAKDAASVDDTNLLFIDGAEKAEVSLYKNYGPNNEVYLASGQAISFKLTGELSKIATIQVGAKKPDGSDAVMTVNNKNVSIANSATEMYYTITRDNNNCVTITNTGANILSLTNLKVTFNEKATVALEKYSTQEQTEVVAAVQALFAAPVEPDPEPVVFAPEYFQATWNRSTVKVGQKATLTVKTSADVETVTVNGQDIGNYRVRTERTGWGWNAKKVTYHVFTFTVTATEAGTLDYSVVAANAEGVNSEAITATLTVQAAAQRPGFGGWLGKLFGRWF